MPAKTTTPRNLDQATRPLLDVLADPTSDRCDHRQAMTRLTDWLNAADWQARPSHTWHSDRWQRIVRSSHNTAARTRAFDTAHPDEHPTFLDDFLHQVCAVATDNGVRRRLTSIDLIRDRTPGAGRRLNLDVPSGYITAYAEHNNTYSTVLGQLDPSLADWLADELARREGLAPADQADLCAAPTSPTNVSTIPPATVCAVSQYGIGI